MPAVATTVLVADDHPALVAAVAAFLGSHGLSVVQARDGPDALEKLATCRPDVAIIDLKMPGLSGVEVARLARQRSLGTPIILYTGYGDRELVVDALDAGVRGFVLKEAPVDDILRAIQLVQRGDVYVDPVLAGPLAAVAAAARALSVRERDVLRLLAEGLANEEIGKRLFISPETVRTHIRRAMDKLDADTRTQAVAEALRQKLIA